MLRALAKQIMKISLDKAKKKDKKAAKTKKRDMTSDLDAVVALPKMQVATSPEMQAPAEHEPVEATEAPQVPASEPAQADAGAQEAPKDARGDVTDNVDIPLGEQPVTDKPVVPVPATPTEEPLSIVIVDAENEASRNGSAYGCLKRGGKLFWMYTNQDRNIPIVVLSRIAKTGATCIPIHCERTQGQGKQELDMQIDTLLGYLIHKHGDSATYTIVSNDNGFAMVSRFWRQFGVDVAVARANAKSGSGKNMPHLKPFSFTLSRTDDTI